MRIEDIKIGNRYRNLRTKEIYRVLEINDTKLDRYVKIEKIVSNDKIKYIHKSLKDFTESEVELI